MENRLRELRIEQGISLREFARKVNCNHATISRIERNLLCPSYGMMLRIARALKKAPVEIFFGLNGDFCEPKAPEEEGNSWEIFTKKGCRLYAKRGINDAS